MDSNTQKEASMPKLCAAGCGFFANPDLNSLCSKCNREKQASEAAVKAVATSAAPAALPSAAPVPAPAQQPAAPAAAPFSPALPASPPASQPSAVSPAAPAPQLLSPQVLEAVAAAAAAGDCAVQQHASAAAEQAAEDDEPPRRVQKNTNRCFSCNKKVGLTGFKCRCGFVFCGPHRLAEAHQCEFDYKTTGRESLAKANPLVQADRVTRF